MKDKTHSMNWGVSAEASAQGYEKIPNSEMASTHDRKVRQMKWANLEDNKGLALFEGMDSYDVDPGLGHGFLPRNNYEDRK